jgi:hypothetical protein
MHYNDFKNIKFIIKELELEKDTAVELINKMCDVNEDYISCITICSLLLGFAPQHEQAVKNLIDRTFPSDCDKAWFIVLNAALTMR